MTLARNSWIGRIALAAVAAAGLSAGAGAAREPLPAGVKACAFDALTNDPDPAGPNVRAAPSATAPILGRLPPTESADAAMGTILPSFHVIGVQDGWFLIEGARYDPGYDVPRRAPKPYAGRGWVAGNRITTGLRTMSLKQAPRADAPDVVGLSGETDGSAFGPSEVTVRRILDCAGPWFRVEVPLDANGVRLKPATASDGPKDAVRGWTTGFCTEQLTTCV